MFKKYCSKCNEYSYSASRSEDWYCSNCGKKIKVTDNKMQIMTA